MRLALLKTGLVTLILAVTMLGLVYPAYAATLIVNTDVDEQDGSCSDGDCSLRDAIALAAVGDTITFASDMTITLSSELGIAKNLTIDGSGLTTPVTLDGNNAVRIFKVMSSARVTLQGLTLTQGRDSGAECDSQTYYAPTAVSCGGGIKIEPGSVVTATEITVQRSHAYMGGGIYNAGTLLIRHSTIISNTSGEGGGIHNTRYSGGLGVLTVQTCTIAGNTANADSLAGSSAGLNTGGGGIYDYQGSVTVQASTLSGNTAASPSSGGGLHSLWGDVLIQNSTLSGNTSPSGGGIYNYWATVTLQNSTLAGNSSSWLSGGIYLFYGTLHYQNTMIANNSGGDCGFAFDEIQIGTNINNWVGDASPQCSAEFSGDPFIGPLADNGPSTLPVVAGPATWTHALLPGSPAIDAGDAATCLDVDQRGIDRPQGATCDIGAVESRGFSLTYGGGSGQSTFINTAFTNPLSVTLTETGGSGLPGAVITFTAPSAGASIAAPTTVTTTTLSNGIASLPVTANVTVGSYVVTATARGNLGGAITYNLTNTPPSVTLLVSAGSGAEADQTAIIVTAAALAPVGGDQTVDLGVTGTGITAGDYSLSNTTITIPDGQSSGSVTFTIQDDAVDENDETATLTLSSPSAGLALGSPISQDVTITNNDDTRNVALTQSDGATTVTEDGTTDTYTVRLATIPTNTVTVNFNAGSQLQAITSLTFAADDTALNPQTVTIQAVDDTDVEGDHNQVISHSASGGGYGGVSINNVTAAIADNDLNFAITANQAEVTEGSGGNTAIRFTVTRSGAVTTTSGAASFSLSGTATTGVDYTNVTPAAQVSFVAGETQKSISITVVGDFSVEPDETITVTLTGAGGPGSVFTPTYTAQTVILNDDAAGYTITPNTFTVVEGSSQVVTVTLASQPVAAVTITLSSSALAQCTVAPAAVTLDQSNWHSGATFAISGVRDGLSDGDQSCTIVTTVSTADSVYSSLDPADVTLTVADEQHIYLPFILKGQ